MSIQKLTSAKVMSRRTITGEELVHPIALNVMNTGTLVPHIPNTFADQVGIPLK
jgi:hypothetical protein